MNFRSVLRSWLFKDLAEVRSEDATASDRAARFWGWDLFGTQNSTAGVIVNEDSAKNVAAVFAAVSIISGAIGTMPLLVYRSKGKGQGKELAEGDPILRLLLAEPNPLMTAAVFRETMQANNLLWGNAYAEIEWSKSHVPLAFWPIHPGRVVPKFDGRRLTYHIRNEGAEVVIQPENMLHIPGLGNGIIGESVISHARTSIGLSIAADEFGAGFFGNSAIPSILLSYPGVLKPEAKENLRNSWIQRFSGPRHAQRPAILEEGLKIEKISIPPEDAQFLQTRQHQIKDIANWFQIPSHMICGDEKPSYASVEQRFQEFVQLTLNRHMSKWEQEINRKVLEIPSTFCRFDTGILLRGDTKTRYEANKIAIESGWKSRQEVREEENLNPAEGLDVFLQPMNFAPANSEPEEPVEDPDRETDPEGEPKHSAPSAPPRPAPVPARNLRPLVEGAWRRLVTREVKAHRKALEDTATFKLTAAEFWKRHAEIVEQTLREILPAIGRPAEDARRLARDYVSDNWDTLARLLDGTHNGDARGRIEPLLTIWENDKVARQSSALLGGE